MFQSFTTVKTLNLIEMLHWRFTHEMWRSHSSEYKSFLGCDTILLVRVEAIIGRSLLPPSLRKKTEPHGTGIPFPDYFHIHPMADAVKRAAFWILNSHSLGTSPVTSSPFHTDQIRKIPSDLPILRTIFFHCFT